MTLEFSVPIGKHNKCFLCGEVFTEEEPRVFVMYAGSAWKDGRAELVDGAEMFETRAFHEQHAPPPAPSEEK